MAVSTSTLVTDGRRCRSNFYDRKFTAVNVGKFKLNSSWAFIFMRLIFLIPIKDLFCAKTDEPTQGTLTEGKYSVQLTSLDSQAEITCFWYCKHYLFWSKQAALVWRSIVLNLLLQLVFPGRWFIKKILIGFQIFLFCDGLSRLSPVKFEWSWFRGGGRDRVGADDIKLCLARWRPCKVSWGLCC
jgi:hypothetical protein